MLLFAAKLIFFLEKNIYTHTCTNTGVNDSGKIHMVNMCLKLLDLEQTSIKSHITTIQHNVQLSKMGVKCRGFQAKQN